MMIIDCMILGLSIECFVFYLKQIRIRILNVNFLENLQKEMDNSSKK